PTRGHVSVMRVGAPALLVIGAGSLVVYGGLRILALVLGVGLAGWAMVSFGDAVLHIRRFIPNALCLSFAVALFASDATFRTRSVDAGGLDAEVLAKIALLALPMVVVAMTAIRSEPPAIPLKWLRLYCAWALVSAPASLLFSQSVATALVHLSVIFAA